MKRIKWIFIIIGIGVFLILAAHQSNYPHIFNRYSTEYFIFLAAYAIILISLILFHNYMFRVWQMRKNLPKLIASCPSFFSFRYLIAIVFAFHTVLVFIFLKPTVILSSSPILETDYAHHYYQVELVVKALANEGQSWAYNPSFCAGYPEGTLFDVDMKFVELAAFLLTRIGFSIPLVFNALIFFMFWSVPLLLYWSCRNFEFSKGATALILMLCVLSWHSHDMITLFNQSGMVSFVFGTYWSILVVSLLYRYLKVDTWVHYGLFLISLCIAFMIHILMPFLIAIPIFVLYIYNFKKMSMAKHGILISAALIAILANSWWLTTILSFFHYRLETAFFSPPPITSVIQNIIKFKDMDIGYCLLGFWGFYNFRHQEKCIAMIGMTWIAWFLFMAYGLESIPLLKSLEPQRFKIPLSVVSFIGFSLSANLLIPVLSGVLEKFRLAFPIVIVALFFCGSAFMPRIVVDFFSSKEGMEQLVQGIQENTSREARIAFMDQSPGFLTGAKIHYYTERELIGGPFSQLNMKHSYASFTKDRFFDKRLIDLTEEDILYYSNLFNIRWLITTTDQGFAIFSKFHSILSLKNQFVISERKQPTKMRSESPFFGYERKQGEYLIGIFEIKNNSTYFLEGAGDIEANVNVIKIRNATPGGVILKYHWLETLSVDPPMPMTAYSVAGNKLGFIKVENGTNKEFTIFNSYHFAPD